MTFTPNELELIGKLRSRVADVVPADKLQNDHFLIRWLRARDMDLEKAVIMLRKSVDWFETHEIDTILDWKPKTNNFRYAKLGHDAEGCPVFLIPFGLWQAHEVSDKDEVTYAIRIWFRKLAYLENEIKLASEKFGKSVTQFVMIVDYQQLSYLRFLSNRSMVQASIEFASMFEANFPETLKCCILVNTARLFPLILKLVKPFLSARTLSKLEIHGPNRRKWIEALEAKIPMEILPPHYGGTRKGNDEYCSSDTTMWNDGEPLPPHFYSGIPVSNRRRKSSTFDLRLQMQNSLGLGSSRQSDAWKRQEIQAGSQIDLEFEVGSDLPASSMQILHWEVKSEDYDIGLKVTFRADGQENLRDVVEYSRVNSHVTPIIGSLLCEEPGVYTLVLDNTYSRRRNKMVSYNVELTETKRRMSLFASRKKSFAK